MGDAAADEYSVVAVGASAGGIEPLRELLEHLPPALNAAVVVAVHGLPGNPLVQTLETRSKLPVKVLKHGDRLRPGVAHVVAAGSQVKLTESGVEVSSDPLGPGVERTFRPSLDALFSSLAMTYGERGIAVVLSGRLDDGAVGCQILHYVGGTTLVQDPEEARYPSMPQNVINLDHPEHVLSARELASKLVQLIEAN